VDDAPLPEGISSTTVETPPLRTRVLMSGDERGVPVLFIPGCGHSPHVERPEILSQMLLDFPDKYE
jgi:hypothetical protein